MTNYRKICEEKMRWTEEGGYINIYVPVEPQPQCMLCKSRDEDGSDDTLTWCTLMNIYLDNDFYCKEFDKRSV